MPTFSTPRSRPGSPTALHSLLLASLAALLLTPATQADTVKVAPGESIQDAIDAAAPGDTLVIAGGTYEGRYVIPAGKDGLEIKGKGKVILDAAQTPVEGGPPAGFSIDSSNVVLRNLTIRHAPDLGITTLTSQSGLTLDKLTILNCGNSAIRLEADTSTVNRCTVRGTANAGIELNGDGAILTRNTVSSCGSDALKVTGDGALISRNKLSDATDNGIDVLGQDAFVERNSISRTDDSAITITGDQALLDGNTIDVVCNDAGILVTGGSATIMRNKISSVVNGKDGIRLLVFTSSGLVDRNTLRDCRGAGVFTAGDDITISRNKVTDCGGQLGSIDVTGDTNTLSKNVVKGSPADGIRLAGNGNLLQGNKVSDSLQDGIVVGSGTANTLDGNNIRKNQGEGVENGAMGTVLSKNKICKNRIDVVNDSGSGATITIEDDNSICDGSDGSDDPEV
jgi:parallel beta-helix repeat protein